MTFEVLAPTPVACVLFAYLASIPLLAAARDALGGAPRCRAVRAFALAHNVALALFSAWVASRAWPALAARVATAGLVALCDLPPDEAWLSLVFYRSKYYEFVDTWLVVLAGKRPSLLQVYHHVGVVAVMRGALAAGAGPIVVLTALNAAVHAAMYAYYALATVGVKWRHARLLTRLQLAQFVVGVGLTSVGYFTDAGSCGDARAHAAIVGVHVYVAGLVALFARFYRARYAPCVRAPR
jgi:hypothetical protein